MSKLAYSLTLTLAAAGVCGLAAYAQTPKTDPVKADPKHYKVELENDNVRVLRVHYEPGEKSVMHFHPRSVAVYLTDGKTRMTLPDGKSMDSPGKAGAVSWADAGSHLPQNVGSRALDVIVVELKK